MASRGGVGRGRVWRTVVGVAVAGSLSIGGAQVARADEPVVDTAAPPAAPVLTETATPPVVESSVPHPVAGEEPVVVAVGLPPVPPAQVNVGVAEDEHIDHDADIDPDVDASTVGGAVAATLAAAAFAGWRSA